MASFLLLLQGECGGTERMNEKREDFFEDEEKNAKAGSAQARSHYPTPLHSSSKPRGARHDLTYDLLTKHYNANTTGHLENEMATPQIHAAMQDAKENYEIMMAFHRELRNAYEKIIDDHRH